ncbi:MAG: hypothetical protein LIR46_02960 [Bacteroidota bacterium]|nr:hypothetical protein [Bacteroidota bacterium]
MDIWNTDVTNLPKNGSVLDIIITDNLENEPLGMIVGFVIDGKIMTTAGVFSGKMMDITNSVKKWHKLPNVIYKDNKLYWDEEIG